MFKTVLSVLEVLSRRSVSGTLPLVLIDQLLVGPPVVPILLDSFFYSVLYITGRSKTVYVVRER